MRHTISNLRSFVAALLLVVTTASASAGGWVAVTSLDQITPDRKYVIQSDNNGWLIQLLAMGYDETNVINATPLVPSFDEATLFTIVPGETEGTYLFQTGPFYLGQSTHERFTWNTKAVDTPTEWEITSIGEGVFNVSSSSIGQWKVDGSNPFLYIDGGINQASPDFLGFWFYYYDENYVEDDFEEVEEPEIIYESEVELDETAFSLDIPEYMTYAVDVKLNRSIMNAGEKTTICLPFKMSYEKIEEVFGEGTEVRAFTRAENGNLYFQSTSLIEAGVPYMILPGAEPENGYYTIPNVTSSSFVTEAQTIERNDYAFRGIFTPQTVSGTYYAYNGGRLTKYTTEHEMNAFRGYFYATSAEAKPLHSLFAEDETTGISELVVEETAGKGVYNLSGAKVSSTDGLAKGVYVVNGKKVVVK